jgi:hypothetical protein
MRYLALRVLKELDASIAPIAGTVLLQVVVSENRRLTEITVLSPIGFGLDERAEAAVIILQQKTMYTPLNRVCASN